MSELGFESKHSGVKIYALNHYVNLTSKIKKSILVLVLLTFQLIIIVLKSICWL